MPHRLRDEHGAGMTSILVPCGPAATAQNAALGYPGVTTIHLTGGTFICGSLRVEGALIKAKFPERIIDMLRAEPDGLTSKGIAERLGTTAANIGSRLI
jgi:hypothetical protein